VVVKTDIYNKMGAQPLYYNVSVRVPLYAYSRKGPLYGIRGCIKLHFLCSSQAFSEAENVDVITMYKFMYKR
jgi:hypothetical protein